MKLTSIFIGGILILSLVLAISGCSSNKSTATVQPTAKTQPADPNRGNSGQPVFPAPSTAKTQTAASSQPATNTQVADPTPPSGYVLVKSADGNVAIFVPSGWNTNNTQLYPGSIIGISDDTTKEYLIITEKTKVSVKTNSTINDYVSQAKSAFSTAVNNPVWGQPSDITVGGCKGLALRLTGTRKSNGTDTVYFVNILESKNYYYDVAGYTLTASESANKPTLDAIINSFKEKD
jgi:hypothetical protein